MSDKLKVRKGLDIPLAGVAEKALVDVREGGLYAIKPTDFVALTPKLAVKEGELVKAGSTLFFDKNNPAICFTSPVSGTVKEVVRGDRRMVLAVTVESDGKMESASFATGATQKDQIVELMLSSGLWTMLRQRPFGTIANPADKAKAIFVSCFDSAPLAPDFDFVMKGRENDFVAGVKALAALTEGKMHLSFRPGQQLKSAVENAKIANVVLHEVEGPHPAGLVGTQISMVDPINAGERVWTMDVQSIATLGHLIATGEYRPQRVVAFAGPVAKKPCYYNTLAGACVMSMVEEQMADVAARLPKETSSYRLISGNVLTGTRIEANGFLGAYDSLLCVIPEGDYYEFMGWLMPRFRKFSFSRSFLSGFFAGCKSSCASASQKGKYKFDTNFHGEERPLVVTGSFERVVPIDIYPLQLIKAAVIGDIELMENLGIYEVEPEDLALCEFIDTSKTEIQTIIREALEKCRKESC